MLCVGGAELSKEEGLGVKVSGSADFPPAWESGVRTFDVGCSMFDVGRSVAPATAMFDVRAALRAGPFPDNNAAVGNATAAAADESGWNHATWPN